jgi:hypothetical protein
MQDVFFDEFEPLGVTSSPSPPLDTITSVLLVVDTLNTRPGTSGRVQLAELSLGQP